MSKTYQLNFVDTKRVPDCMPASRWRVPKMIASVFSGLSNSAFCENHVDTGSEQPTSDDKSPKDLGTSKS